MEEYDRQGEREVGRERAGGIGETGRDTGVERWGYGGIGETGEREVVREGGGGIGESGRETGG